MPCIAIVFDTDPKTCRARNNRRSRSIPPKVLNSQIARYTETRPLLETEGFAAVHPANDVLPVSLGGWSPDSASPTRKLRFGPQISNFDWGDVSTPDTFAAIARRAEAAGFESLWVMDHFRQIPQVGPAWSDMLEAYTTLAWLAGVTDRIRLGTLVTGLTYRNVGLLAKIVSTLDVLSNGRAICGIGAGWSMKRTGTTIHLTGNASTCSKAPYKPSRCCGVPEPSRLRAKSSTFLKHWPTRDRFRNTYRSWSAGAARSGPSSWWLNMPTPAA